MSKLLQWGNALGLRLPKHIYSRLGWTIGTAVVVELGEGSTAVVRHADSLEHADERYKMARIRPNKAKPYVTTLKRFEGDWVRAYNHLVSQRDAMDPTHKDLPMVRQIIMWMEGEEMYQRLNKFIDDLEAPEPEDETWPKPRIDGRNKK